MSQSKLLECNSTAFMDKGLFYPISSDMASAECAVWPTQDRMEPVSSH